MTKEMILEELENMDDEKLVEVWNEYIDNIKDYENRIFYMYELNDLFTNASATELLAAIDSMDLNDDYFIDSIYGLRSVHYLDTVIDYSELAEYIAENYETFENYFE